MKNNIGGSKGVEGGINWTIVGLILGMIVLALLSYLFITRAYGGFSDIGDLLGMIKTDPATSVFENAVRCSYYRCTKGCDSEEVKNLKDIGPDLNGKKQSCKQLCSSENTCGKENSIKTEVQSEISISKSHFKQIDLDCILSDKSTADIKDFAQNILTGQLSWIWWGAEGAKPFDAVNVQSDHIENAITEDCYFSLTKVASNALTSFTLLSGQYEIFTNKDLTGNTVTVVLGI